MRYPGHPGPIFRGPRPDPRMMGLGPPRRAMMRPRMPMEVDDFMEMELRRRGPRQPRPFFRPSGPGDFRDDSPPPFLRGSSPRPFRGGSPRPLFRGESPPRNFGDDSPPPNFRGRSPPPHFRGRGPPPPYLRPPGHFRGRGSPPLRFRCPPGPSGPRPLFRDRSPPPPLWGRPRSRSPPAFVRPSGGVSPPPNMFERRPPFPGYDNMNLRRTLLDADQMPIEGEMRRKKPLIPFPNDSDFTPPDTGGKSTYISATNVTSSTTDLTAFSTEKAKEKSMREPSVETVDTCDSADRLILTLEGSDCSDNEEENIGPDVNVSKKDVSKDVPVTTIATYTPVQSSPTTASVAATPIRASFFNVPSKIVGKPMNVPGSSSVSVSSSTTPIISGGSTSASVPNSSSSTAVSSLSCITSLASLTNSISSSQQKVQETTNQLNLTYSLYNNPQSSPKINASSAAQDSGAAKPSSVVSPVTRSWNSAPSAAARAAALARAAAEKQKGKEKLSTNVSTSGSQIPGFTTPGFTAPGNTKATTSVVSAACVSGIPARPLVSIGVPCNKNSGGSILNSTVPSGSMPSSVTSELRTKTTTSGQSQSKSSDYNQSQNSVPGFSNIGSSNQSKASDWSSNQVKYQKNSWEQSQSRSNDHQPPNLCHSQSTQPKLLGWGRPTSIPTVWKPAQPGTSNTTNTENKGTLGQQQSLPSKNSQGEPNSTSQNPSRPILRNPKDLPVNYGSYNKSQSNSSATEQTYMTSHVSTTPSTYLKKGLGPQSQPSSSWQSQPPTQPITWGASPAEFSAWAKSISKSNASKPNPSSQTTNPFAHAPITTQSSLKPVESVSPMPRTSGGLVSYATSPGSSPNPSPTPLSNPNSAAPRAPFPFASRSTFPPLLRAPLRAPIPARFPVPVPPPSLYSSTTSYSPPKSYASASMSINPINPVDIGSSNYSPLGANARPFGKTLNKPGPKSTHPPVDPTQNDKENMDNISDDSDAEGDEGPSAKNRNITLMGPLLAAIRGSSVFGHQAKAPISRECDSPHGSEESVHIQINRLHMPKTSRFDAMKTPSKPINKSKFSPGSKPPLPPNKLAFTRNTSTKLVRTPTKLDYTSAAPLVTKILPKMSENRLPSLLDEIVTMPPIRLDVEEDSEPELMPGWRTGDTVREEEEIQKRHMPNPVEENEYPDYVYDAHSDKNKSQQSHALTDTAFPPGAVKFGNKELGAKNANQHQRKFFETLSNPTMNSKNARGELSATSKIMQLATPNYTASYQASFQQPTPVNYSTAPKASISYPNYEYDYLQHQQQPQPQTSVAPVPPPPAPPMEKSTPLTANQVASATAAPQSAYNTAVIQQQYQQYQAYYQAQAQQLQAAAATAVVSSVALGVTQTAPVQAPVYQMPAYSVGDANSMATMAAAYNAYGTMYTTGVASTNPTNRVKPFNVVQGTNKPATTPAAVLSNIPVPQPPPAKKSRLDPNLNRNIISIASSIATNTVAAIKPTPQVEETARTRLRQWRKILMDKVPTLTDPMETTGMADVGNTDTLEGALNMFSNTVNGIVKHISDLNHKVKIARMVDSTRRSKDLSLPPTMKFNCTQTDLSIKNDKSLSLSKIGLSTMDNSIQTEPTNKEDELAEKEKVVSHLLKENNRLKQQFNLQYNKSERLRHERNQLADKKEDMEEELEKMKKKVEELRETRDQMETELEKRDDDYDKLQNSERKLKSEMVEIIDDSLRLRNESERLTELGKRQSAEISALKQKMKTMEKDISQKDRDYADIKMETEEAKSRVAELEKSVEKMQHLKGGGKLKEITELENFTKELEEAVKTAKRQRKEHKKWGEVLQARLDDLVKERDSKLHNETRLKSHIEQLESRKHSFVSTVEKMEKKVGSMEKMMKTAYMERDEVKLELEATMRSYHALQKKYQGSKT